MSTYQATIRSEVSADDLCLVNARVVMQARAGDGYVIELEGDGDAFLLVAAEIGTPQPVFVEVSLPCCE